MSQGERKRLQVASALWQQPDLLALDEALTRLAAASPQRAELVKLRYFAGLSHHDAALALQISRRTADRYWALARAWLYRRLKET